MMPDKLPSAESRRVIKPESPEPSAGAAAAEQEANRILAGIVKANTINPRKCCDCCFRHWGAWLLLPKGILFFLLKKKSQPKNKKPKKQQTQKTTQPQFITGPNCLGAAVDPEAALGCGHLSSPSTLRMLQAPECPGHQGRCR